MNSPIPVFEATDAMLNALIATNVNDAANPADITKVYNLIEEVNARKLISKASNFSAVTDKLVLHGYKVTMPKSWQLEVGKVSERTGFTDLILSIE